MSRRSSKRRIPGSESHPVVPTPTSSRNVAYSFVIPIKDRASRVVELYHQIVDTLGDKDEFELIFIDDASRDRTWRAINDLVTRDPARVRGLRFRRQLGTAAALSAGFRAARGRIIFTLDPDSPIDPRLIPRFLDRLAEGPDVVSAHIVDRGGRWYQALARRVVPRLSYLPQPDLDPGFHCFRAEAVNDLTLHGEHHRMLPALLAIQGFQVVQIAIESGGQACAPGQSGCPRLLGRCLDWLTLSFLQHYRNRPTRAIGGISTTFALCGFSSIAIGTALLFLKVQVAGLVAVVFGTNLVLCSLVGFLWGLLAALTIRAGFLDDRSTAIAEGQTGQERPTPSWNQSC
jgi:hypothetical protein